MENSSTTAKTTTTTTSTTTEDEFVDPGWDDFDDMSISEISKNDPKHVSKKTSTSTIKTESSSKITLIMSLIKIATFLKLIATPFIDTRDIRMGSDEEEKEETNSNLIKASPSSKLYFLNIISMGKALYELAFCCRIIQLCRIQS